LGMFLALIRDCNRNQREIRTKFSWVSSKAFSGGLGWPRSFQPTWRRPALRYERTRRKNAGSGNAKEGILWECGFDFGLIKILIFKLFFILDLILAESISNFWN
jgi:hypothetical protein